MLFLWFDFLGVLLAAGAQSPVDYLGLIDPKSVVHNGLQARPVACGAIDIGRLSALSADGVVMVIAHTRLKPRRVSRGLNSTHEAGLYPR